MSDFAVAIVALLLFFFGILLGARVGDEWGGDAVTKRDYWVANLKILGIGVVGSAVTVGLNMLVLSAMVLGFMTGGVAGAKMAFGESVGPWKAHDRFFRVNKDHLRRAENGNAEAVRRARKEGTPEPELMSVADPGTNKNEGK